VINRNEVTILEEAHNMVINLRPGRAGPFLNSSLVLLIVVFANITLAQQRDKSQSDLIKHFNDAIHDAAVYKESNLRPLNPLKFDSSTLTAKVVTLTAAQYSKGSYKLPDDVWVTAAPEVKNKCQGVGGNLPMWLRQLLGLHPNTEVTHFVVMEVKKGDIFRPTANPDATAIWPCGNSQGRDCGEFFQEGVSEGHIKWMANQMLSAYLISKPLKANGYPWTRLGYTYNWRRGADRYGASEYVIRQGAVVNVEEIISYREYCAT
jgi:hypothetical protein